MADCIVVGAGMVGVATALALQERGQTVVLVDRREPGRETSYGNAGVIQVEAVEPYAFPRSIGEIASAALGMNAKVRWRAGSMHRWGGPLLQYFAKSAPESHKRIAIQYSQLIRRALNDHDPLIEAAGAQALVRRDGFRQIHRSERSFEAAAREAERITASYGVAARLETGKELAAAEPNLRQQLGGAVRWIEAATCADPGALVAAYASLFARRGGTIFCADAGTLVQSGNSWAVTGPNGKVDASMAVVALGPWAGEFLRRFDYRIPMFFKRGYHRHFTGAGPDLPMIDADRGGVISPMRQGLRVLTGAELTWIDSAPSARQLRQVEKAAGELFELGEPVAETAWHGNRPCMPGMLPIVGAAPRHHGLWFNFGHGHQGFTLGPTTAALLADAITCGRTLPSELQLAA
ncbi:MAG TPA: FAD-dependent oxidoreductase [Tianweitania sediminis]|nr:FAD-dependent oxidoreductase [Tianweitania sediminis]